MAVKGALSESFGRLPDGRQVERFTLTNRHGARLMMTNYGATVTGLEAPDKHGVLADLVLGYDRLEDYLLSRFRMGCLIGRFANRIGGASFDLDGRSYALPRNVGKDCLHGGSKGFDKVLWKAEAWEAPQGPAILFSHLSPDGDEGFPGELSVQALHTWTHDHELRIDLFASSNRPTVVNLTHHSYFNLAGAGRGDILDHQMQLFADAFTPMDEHLIVTGEIRGVQGTPFDFDRLTPIRERIQMQDDQLLQGRGFDHNWVLRKEPGALSLAARLVEPASGRMLELSTTQPGVQFYAGNALVASIPGKGGASYGPRSGLCLEPQHFPDSPNRPQFPSTRLDPGQEYRHHMVYRFSTV